MHSRRILAAGHVPSSASISPPSYLRLRSHKVTRVNAFMGSWEVLVHLPPGRVAVTGLPRTHAGCPQLRAPPGHGPDPSRCSLACPPPSPSLPASPPPDCVFLPFLALLSGFIQQRFTRVEKESGDTTPLSIFVSLSSVWRKGEQDTAVQSRP